MDVVWRVLTRRKVLDSISAEETQLGRVLNTFDLTALGVGSTLGVGVYVLAGHVAKDVAGPAVILSFLIAAVASVFAGIMCSGGLYNGNPFENCHFLNSNYDLMIMIWEDNSLPKIKGDLSEPAQASSCRPPGVVTLSLNGEYMHCNNLGLCYAEFGARAPRAGSAYIYSYVCVGEFIAFIIGWNLILEYVIGSASVARGLSLYLDSLLNNTMEKAFIDVAPMHVDFLSAYFDFFAFGISILLAIALAFGMKESSFVNNIFTILNIAVVIFVIIAGSIKADGHNWNLSPYNNSTIHGGSGGFFPFGIEGMIKGAATCFYGFVGFDCIATTGEEVKNPKKAIPISIILSLSIIFLAYFGTSTVVTLMVPYYLQDPDAPIPHAFEVIGWEVPKWIVAIGGIFGLCASLFGAMFPLPRIIYAMASDGIIFRTLGKISEKFKTPVIGTLIAGTLTGLMAAMFELKQLVNMMSIGTLLAYTIVAASVLLLSYEVQENRNNPVVLTDSDDSDTYTDNRTLNEMGSNEEIALISDNFTSTSIVKQLFNSQRHQEPTKISERLVSVQVFIYCIFCLLIGLCAMYLKAPISKGEAWAIVLTALVVCVAVFLIISIAAQPKSKKELSFKVPFVPVIPALSILINVYLMLMLDSHTWIRFAVWMAIGIPTYYFSVKNHYDTRNMSVANLSEDFRKNGVINKGFDSDRLDILENANLKKSRSSIPSPENIRSTIAVLDEMLDNEASKFDGGEAEHRKFSTETESEVGVPVHEEYVEVDVHNVVSPVAEKTEMTFQQRSDSVSNISVLAQSESFPQLNIGIDDKVVEKEENTAEKESKSNEDDIVTQKSVETAVESNDSSPPAIPPPPPPPPLITTEPEHKDFKTYFNTLRGPDFVNALHTVKLKHRDAVNDTPVNDDKVDEEVHDFKFGTPEHTAFLEKLNENLKRQSIPVNYVVPPIAGIPRDTKSISIIVPHDNVVEDHIDRIEAKVKLTELLEKSPLVLSPDSILNHHVKEERATENVGLKEEKEKTDQKEENLDDFKEQHRRNMNNIFGSLKFRNVDNSEAKMEQISAGDKDDSHVSEDKMDDFKEQHRRNMNDIFGSLKLRRVDDDDDDDDADDDDQENKQESERRENEDLSDFKKQHRLNMTNIFGSIKSRNVDSNEASQSEQNTETNQNRNSNETLEGKPNESEQGMTLTGLLKNLVFGKTDESDRVEQ